MLALRLSQRNNFQSHRIFPPKKKKKQFATLQNNVKLDKMEGFNEKNGASPRCQVSSRTFHSAQATHTRKKSKAKIYSQKATPPCI